MRKLYTFSPITTKADFDAAMEYVVAQTGLMAESLTGSRLPLSTVKIFAHYPEEYEFMQKLLPEYGSLASIGRSTSTYIDCDVTIGGSHIVNIGIRRPDPYRMQVGCGDYDVKDPQAFIASLADGLNVHVRPFPDLPDDFVELWHPDYDVAGYVVLK